MIHCEFVVSAPDPGGHRQLGVFLQNPSIALEVGSRD